VYISGGSGLISKKLKKIEGNGSRLALKGGVWRRLREASADNSVTERGERVQKKLYSKLGWGGIQKKKEGTTFN